MIRALMLCLVVLATAACAPVVQTAGAPDLTFSGPRLENEAVVSFDGTRLGLTRWDAEGGEPSVVVVGLHGMNDYAGGFRLAATHWAKHGITTYAYDQRGYGRSPNRGVWPGEALMTEDLRTVTALVRARHPRAILAVAGVSMGGGASIAAFASDRPPDADRLVLLGPAVWGWSSQPLPQKLAAWIAGRTVRGWVVEPPPFVARRIHPTDNLDEWRRMSRDPLMLWGARSDAIYGIIDLMETASQGTGRIKVPTAYFYGYHDEIIPYEPSFEAASRLKPADRTAYYRDGWHLLLIDKQAERVWDDVEAFIRDPAAPLPSGAPPLVRQTPG